jgi:hypothetical protein
VPPQRAGYIRSGPTTHFALKKPPFDELNHQKMDATITYDKVAALVGINIPTLEPCLNFEQIRMLRRHFKRDSSASDAPKASNTDGREW